MDVYSSIIYDHYKNPRNNRVIADPDLESELANPSCGDVVKFQAKLAKNQINEIAFTGNGCAISMATASLLSEHFRGKTLANIIAFNTDDLKKLIQLDIGPVRLKCALLPLQALQQAVNVYQKKLL